MQHLLLKLHHYLIICINSLGFTAQEKPFKLFYLTKLSESMHSCGIKQNLVTFSCSKRPVLTFHFPHPGAEWALEIPAAAGRGEEPVIGQCPWGPEIPQVRGFCFVYQEFWNTAGPVLKKSYSTPGLFSGEWSFNSLFAFFKSEMLMKPKNG